MDTPPLTLYSVSQASHALGITERAVRHRIQAGTLHAVKVGNARTNAYVITGDEVARAKAAQQDSDE